MTCLACSVWHWAPPIRCPLSKVRCPTLRATVALPLTRFVDGRLVGNAVDLEMFKKSGCAMDGSVVRCGDQRVEIVRVLPFEHGRQRMSVVVRDLSSGALSLFCKGSPEQVAALADPALLPADFDSVVKRHAREGHYTLAVAHRPVSNDDLSGSREHLERHLSVLGVVMFVNPLKPCTADAIAELAPSTRCVMVTTTAAVQERRADSFAR